MKQVWRVAMLAGVLAGVGAFAAARVSARQIKPGAPSGLTFLVDGSSVRLQWTHSTGTFTHYRLEAGAGPGQTFYVFDTSVFVNPNLLPQMVANFAAGPVGAATYYVRMRGVNGTVLSDPSNEVVIRVTGGCQAPGAPTSFTAIVRDTAGFLQWYPGDGGKPTSYLLLASYVPNDPAPPFRIPVAADPNAPAGSDGLALGIPVGTYYARMVAVNACGASSGSNEVQVVSPSNTADRVPNPAPGQRLSLPDVRAVVNQLVVQAYYLGYLAPDVVCPLRPGYASTDIEARKTQPNAFITYVVANLRGIDRRFGYNTKPTRANAIIAGDEVAYHTGSDAPEGSPNVILIDVLGGHCTGVNGTPIMLSQSYRVFTNEFGRWTAGGQFTPSPGARTANPAPGQRLPLPNMEAEIRSWTAARPDLFPAQQCPLGVKYVNNPWQDYIMDKLRQVDTRWGYNAKPTRTDADNGGRPVVAAGDEILYNWGSNPDEGNTNEVYAVDMLSGHCGTPSITWRVFTGEEPVRWTGAGRF